MAADSSPRPYQVGVYYFPNYHVDSRNEAAHGKGWTEWELVKLARPRFPGHRQPLGQGDNAQVVPLPVRTVRAGLPHTAHAS